MDTSLFDKYKNIEPVKDGTLPISDQPIIESMALKVCAYCGRKLYPKIDFSKWFCKSKRCGYYLSNRRHYFVSGEKIKEAENWIGVREKTLNKVGLDSMKR